MLPTRIRLRTPRKLPTAYTLCIHHSSEKLALIEELNRAGYLELPALTRHQTRCDSRVSNIFFPLRVASSDGGATRYASSVRRCSSVGEPS